MNLKIRNFKEKLVQRFTISDVRKRLRNGTFEEDKRYFTLAD